MEAQFIKHHFPHFKKIVAVNDPTKSVAYCNIRKQWLYINIPKFQLLPFEHKFFVLAHEEGHCILHTTDELKADAHAYSRYEKMDYNNDEAVKALHCYLDMKNPVHKARVWQQIQRSLRNDFEEKKIQTAYRERYETMEQTKQKLRKILNK
jgi:hypothetical protein